VKLANAQSFAYATGKGVTGEVDGHKVVLGNSRLLEEMGITTGELEAKAESLRKEGQTVMFVAVDGKAAGLLGVADPIKATTAEAIKQLHSEGIRIVMLTGDNRTTAEAVARKLGIDEVVPEVLPDQKVDAVQKLQAEGRIVAMAGDGINDAPALALAHVGIAMGTGTDVAIASAPVVLISGDVQHVVKAILLSRRTLQTIKQNLFWAFFYNILLVPAAAMGWLNPMLAAGAMAFSSIFVVTNSLRLRNYLKENR